MGIGKRQGDKENWGQGEGKDSVASSNFCHLVLNPLIPQPFALQPFAHPTAGVGNNTLGLRIYFFSLRPWRSWRFVKKIHFH
ncbi:MAG: hypothetical protein V7L20_22640 [Nostoc sp.]